MADLNQKIAGAFNQQAERHIASARQALAAGETDCLALVAIEDNIKSAAQCRGIAEWIEGGGMRANATVQMIVNDVTAHRSAHGAERSFYTSEEFYSTLRAIVLPEARPTCP